MLSYTNVNIPDWMVISDKYKYYILYLQGSNLPSVMDNQTTIELIRNGDRDFFRSLYHSIAESCRKYILKRGGNEAMADEILHEGLYRFFVRVKEKGDFEMRTSIESVVFGFIKMVWKQKCSENSKYKNLHRNIDEDEWLKESLGLEDNPEDIVYGKDLDDTEIIMELMDYLGKDCKEVLIAFYVEKQSLQDISLKLKLTYEYTKLKRYRCIAELRNKYVVRIPQ